MSYQYSMSGGGASTNSPAATATFNVNGPTSPTVAVTPSSTRVQTVQNTSGANIQIATFGAQDSPWPTAGAGTPQGMFFDATVTQPSGYSSLNLKWVQIIDSGSSTSTASTTTSCTIGTGIDGPYPYKDGIANADDSPSRQLLTGTYTEETETVSFTMYLMWDSHLTNSIPIALGHVDWTWSFDAKFANNTWSLVSSSGGPTTTQAFTVSNSFPIWSNEITGNPCNSN